MKTALAWLGDSPPAQWRPEEHVPQLGCRFFQVGYVVQDARAGLDALRRNFDVRGCALFPIADLRNQRYLRRAVDCTVAIALAYISEIQIELVQPLDRQGIYADFLSRWPSGRAHHVGFKTLDRDVFAGDWMRLESAGHAVKHQGELSESGVFAYFDTGGPYGCCFELVRADFKLERLFDEVKAGNLQDDL